MEEILRLYPLPSQEVPLTGLYLAHNLRQVAGDESRPFFYANFIASIDGRIAIPAATGTGLMVPKTTANPRDWRLFQELAAQADILLSSGRYLRDWAGGHAQEILQVADPRFADLARWRMERGLSPQPDIAILSRSLDFPIPPVLTENGRRVVVFTTETTNPQRVKEIEAKAGRVIIAGESGIDGSLLAQSLSELGYRVVYSAAGPRVLDILIEAAIMDRLYLTQASRIIGGRPFATIVDGPLLDPPANFKLHHLYLDPIALNGAGQLFLSYNRLES